MGWAVRGRFRREGACVCLWPFVLMYGRKQHNVGMCAKPLQLHLTLCNPMDCSLPGSSVHGILQARVLEWVAIPSSRGSS